MPKGKINNPEGKNQWNGAGKSSNAQEVVGGFFAKAKKAIGIKSKSELAKEKAAKEAAFNKKLKEINSLTSPMIKDAFTVYNKGVQELNKKLSKK